MLVAVLPKLPEPLKKHKKRPQVAHPHSIAQDYLWFGLPHAGSAVAILRRTSHCGETARFLPPFLAVHNTPFFFGGTQHPLFFWRYTTPPCCTQKKIDRLRKFNRTREIEFNFFTAWTICMKRGTLVHHVHGYKILPQIFLNFCLQTWLWSFKVEKRGKIITKL